MSLQCSSQTPSRSASPVLRPPSEAEIPYFPSIKTAKREHLASLRPRLMRLQISTDGEQVDDSPEVKKGVQSNPEVRADQPDLSEENALGLTFVRENARTKMLRNGEPVIICSPAHEPTIASTSAEPQCSPFTPWTALLTPQTPGFALALASEEETRNEDAYDGIEVDGKGGMKEMTESMAVLMGKTGRSAQRARAARL
jgi:hypothetical protein